MRFTLYGGIKKNYVIDKWKPSSGSGISFDKPYPMTSRNVTQCHLVWLYVYRNGYEQKSSGTLAMVSIKMDDPTNILILEIKATLF